ncbi:hypothetical protein AHAS_Ahas11G0182100 [Arachis hypogaea]
MPYQLGLRIDGDPRTDSHRPSGLLSSHGSRIRWLRLLEDLDRCGRLSWGSAVLAWLYCQMCRATEHGQLILDGCVSLLLSWAYHHISMLPPDGFDTRRFPLVERFVAYRPDNARDEHRLRHYRRTLKGIGILNVEWMPYADLQLHGLVPPMIKGGNGPLNIDQMHRHDGRFGQGEWFAHFLGGCHEMWDACANHRLHIHHHIDLYSSLPYMIWYPQWAHIELFGRSYQHLVASGVVPDDLPIHHSDAPNLHHPEDGDLPELRPAAGRGREDVGWAENVGQTVGSLLGPVPEDYLSLRPLESHHSEAGTCHQGHTSDAGSGLHFDLGTHFELPFSPSELGP